MPSLASKSERIEIRTTQARKALLQRAANSSHKSVTEFLLEAGFECGRGDLGRPARVSTRR